MSSDSYNKAKAIFQSAIELPSEERPAFVKGACGSDDALRREVDAWIAAAQRAGSTFLEGMAVRVCETCAGTFPIDIKFCPHCGQPLHDDPRALVGTRLDNLYQIEALLGQGGMGAVYRARHVLLGDLVAIKTLKRELGDSPSFLKRFQREGRAARSFRHPNAVVVHDLRTTATGRLYMVLELIDGTNLRVVLHDRGRMTPAEALEILEPIAGVLDAAHRRGVIHRDIKPENVMVGRVEGGGHIVKVLDLGIAKMNVAEGEVSTELTVVGTVLGTPQYMSPEQWGIMPRDGGGDVDGRADVYSLGIVAYELVTGVVPFTADSIPEFRQAHAVAEIPLAHTTAGTLPERFGLAIARALAKDRGDRFATAGEFVEELAEALRESEGATADQPNRRTAAAPGDETVVESLESKPSEAGPAPVAGDSADAAEPTRHLRRLGLAIVSGLALAALVVGLAALLRSWPAAPSTVGPAAVSADPAPPPPVETAALAYELEVRSRAGAVSRVSGKDAIGRGDGFRFVFTPAVSGRIAVIGPDTGNVPKLFLAASDGNALEPGSLLAFPNGKWFGTTFDTPSDTLTIVFFPDGVAIPAFAAGPSGRRLSIDEQLELTRFVASNGVAPRFGTSASVSLDPPRLGEPFAAEVTIYH